MKARLVPTARGVHWLAEGWRLFRVAPPAWLGLMLAYLMLVVLVGPILIFQNVQARAFERGS